MSSDVFGSVLIVDDDDDIREVLGEALDARGFDVSLARNGREALGVLEEGRVSPSAILLDLMMPVLDGYGFLDEQRKRPRIADIPVAVITAGDAIDYARLGPAIPILAKPIGLTQLVGVLRGLQTGHR